MIKIQNTLLGFMEKNDVVWKFTDIYVMAMQDWLLENLRCFLVN